MSEKKRKCWAECLGDCRGPLSLEHIASAAIFEGDTFTSHGMHWAKEGITLKTSRMGSHILCKHHNETTSHLDACAGKLSRALRDYWRSRRNVVLTLNGEEFERWSIKLLTNMMTCGWFFPHKTTPPPFLVECVFGLRKVALHAGLHSILGFRHKCTPNNFSFMPLATIQPGKLEVHGIIFNFQSLLFSFFPTCGNHTEFLHKLGNRHEYDLTNAKLLRHPRELQFERRQRNRPFSSPQRFKVKFEWDAATDADRWDSTNPH
jgi:hypothetical protein